MILDIILAGVIAVCVYFGFKRGFVKSLSNMCSLLISVVVAFLSYSKITEFIAKSPVGKFVTEKLSDSIGSSAVELSSVPEFLRKPIEAGVESAADTVANNLATVIIGVISVIITVILVKFLIKFLFKVLNVFAKIPVIKQCNRLLGGLFGFVSGMFWVYIAVLALTYISIIPSAEFLREIMDTSYVVSMVSENGFLLGFFPDTK